MLNKIWAILLLVGFGAAIINGRVEEATMAAIDSSKAAIEICLGLLGIICLWSGLMNIAQKSGLMTYISKIAAPFMGFLFPEIPKSHPAMGAILMNMTANFLGLGNAATPFGIKAMNEMQKLNFFKDTASNSMCMFLVLNAASLQLIPATIIAIRASCGSNNPAEIVGPIWITSICASITGIILAKIFARRNIKIL